MCHRHDKLDVSATLTTHFLLGHLNTTTVAHYAFVAYALVLAAGALIVACRTEDALAEQSVALRLVGAVVDGLGLCHLTEGILENFLRRSQPDSNLREIILYFCIFLKSHIFVVLRVFGLIEFNA